MAQLRQDYQEFLDRSVALLVTGPDSPAAFASYWQEHRLPFAGLPDPHARVLKLYGQEVNLFKFGRMPAQVIVDKAGMVRYAHYGSSMSDIPSSTELFAILDQL